MRNRRLEQEGVPRVGVSYNILLLLVSRDPEHFENPKVFDPSRFAKENSESMKRMSFLAFGEGSILRRCFKFLVFRLTLFYSRTETVRGQDLWNVPSQGSDCLFNIQVPGGAIREDERGAQAVTKGVYAAL